MSSHQTAGRQDLGMTSKPETRAGDLLLERYLPGADEDTRERARETFRQFGLHLARVGARIRRDLDSTDLEGRHTISEAPQESPPSS